jgi:hypothetical protein
MKNKERRYLAQATLERIGKNHSAASQILAEIEEVFKEPDPPSRFQGAKCGNCGERVRIDHESGEHMCCPEYMRPPWS